MWDGSAVPLDENIEIAQDDAAAHEGDQRDPRGRDRRRRRRRGRRAARGHQRALYTTLDDVEQAVEALGLGEQGRYIAALTFGNVHGVYKPGNVKLRPELLGEIQDGIAAKYGTGRSRSTSSSTAAPARPTTRSPRPSRNGVIKMNIDTDTQYAFTRSIADTMFTNYDGVLKVDGEVGNKKIYDPRAWGKVAETAMAARVVEATKELGSAGQSQS